jgi:hypothetical protein
MSYIETLQARIQGRSSTDGAAERQLSRHRRSKAAVLQRFGDFEAKGQGMTAPK